MQHWLRGMLLFAVMLVSGSITSAAPPEPLLLAHLRGFQEVPAVSTVSEGQFRAVIVNDTRIDYELSFSGLEGTVTQAHIHFGQRGVSGGISLWLCQTATNKDPTNLSPTCPQTAQGPTAVTGSLTSANLVGPAAQLINEAGSNSATEFAEILKAIRAGVTYANVHSTKVPSGEIRGQIRAVRERKE